MGQGRRAAHARNHPLRRRRQVVDRDHQPRRRARRGRRAGDRPGLLRHLRLRRRTGRVGARRARGRGGSTWRGHLADHHRGGHDHDSLGARGRSAYSAGRRGFRRRRPRQRALDGCGCRRGRAHQRRWPREGRARPRPGGYSGRPGRRAVAAAPPGRRLPDVLDLPRGRAVRGDAGDAGPPRARPGDLARAGRHHPAYRRRRRRPRPGGDPRTVLEGPRGARVRRPVGRRGARAALFVDERSRGAVRAPPAQRHAPGHRRRRRGPRRGDRLVARAGRVAAPECGRRRHAHRGRDRPDHRDRGHGPRTLRRPGRLDGRRRRRRVGARPALR